MTSSKNIKWYMTEAVATALRSRQLAMTSERDERTGATLSDVAASEPYRIIRKAYREAFNAGTVAEQLGVPHAVMADRLGLFARPDMVVAAVVGAPYEWVGSRQMDNAEKAVDEIEMAFGPVRRRVAAEA